MFIFVDRQGSKISNDFEGEENDKVYELWMDEGSDSEEVKDTGHINGSQLF